MFNIFSRRKPHAARLAAVLGLTIPLFFQGCINIFDPIDSPSNDAQLLSAARACFDEGDFSCAREYYGKLANNEDAKAELAFVKLDEVGAGIGSFVRALDAASGSSAGMILTVLAEQMAPFAGSSARASLLSAYQASLTISNTELKGFVQFMAGIAIAAEILAELDGAQTDKILQRETDIVANSAGCRALAAGACANALCANTSAYTWSGTGTDLNAAGSLSKNWDTLHGAISAASTGLTNMNVTNSTSQSVALATNLLNLLGTLVADARCMQWALVSTSIGVGR